jgi:hypothetical protein
VRSLCGMGICSLCNRPTLRGILMMRVHGLFGQSRVLPAIPSNVYTCLQKRNGGDFYPSFSFARIVGPWHHGVLGVNARSSPT